MMATTALLSPASSADPGGPQGIHIVPASIGCLYPPAIEDADLLQVDFSRRQLDGDGLYLVEEVRADRVIWRGARRFQRTAESLYLDQSGKGEYVGIASIEAIGWRIAGLVLEVYRPTRRAADRTTALWRSA